MIQRKSEFKFFIIMLCYTVIANAYPYIRFQNNWTNSDFTHIVPQLAYSIQNNTIIAKEAFGNGLFYSIIAVELDVITGVTLPALLMFTIPFAVGILSVIALYTYIRSFVRNPGQRMFAISLLFSSPIVLIIITSGKHIIFTWTLSFLLLFLIKVVGDDYRARFVLLSVCISAALILFHLYISVLTFVLAFAYWWVIRGGYSFGFVSNIEIRPFLFLLFANIIAWVTYYMFTPLASFNNFLARLFGAFIIGQNTTSTANSTASGASETIMSIGIPGARRFVSLLASRWDPWWLWIVLNISLLFVLLMGGLVWSHYSINRIVEQKQVTDIYVWTSVAGFFGIIVLLLGLRGYSAQNVIFRYLRYFIPITVVFICLQINPRRWLSTHYLTGLLMLILAALLITAPLNLSREMVADPHRVHSASEASAVVWHNSYGDSSITVEDSITLINTQQVYQIELNNYSFKEKLPITVQSTGRTMHFSPFGTNYSSRYGKIYSSGKAGIHTF